jgi:hypothetical protein
MIKVLVYADSVREARRIYPEREGEAVGYRVASEFTHPEPADMIIHAKEYPEIQEAYLILEEKQNGE